MLDNFKISSIFLADDIVLLCENGDEINGMIKIIAKVLQTRKCPPVQVPRVSIYPRLEKLEQVFKIWEIEPSKHSKH